MLPITLCAAAAAGVLAIWLMIRVGQVRIAEEVSVGDGGNERVIRRMRAHSNYIESAPFVVILIGLIEMAGKGGNWLPYVTAIYFIGRIAHAFGMDGGSLGKGRTVGTVVTLLTLLGLSVVAVVVATGVMK